MFLPRKILEQKLVDFLAEDLGQGDLTSSLVVEDGTIAEANVIAKQEGVVAGIEESLILLESQGLSGRALIRDGEVARKKQTLIEIKGEARAILSVERTLLNVLSRMSGIATATRAIVNVLESEGLKTRVASTRKSSPGLLYFDKKAVWIGGGDSHRLHLDDEVLIKDNHIVLVGGIDVAVRRAKQGVSFTKKIEVEVKDCEGAIIACEAGVDIIMLDNFSSKRIRDTMRSLVAKRVRDAVLVEASGGINAANVLNFARSGVDIVSVGEITHSARALDVSLEIIKKER